MTTAARLPFSEGSDLFRAFRRLWKEEIGEDLSYEEAQAYGPKLLALVGALARWKRSGRARPEIRISERTSPSVVAVR